MYSLIYFLIYFAVLGMYVSNVQTLGKHSTIELQPHFSFHLQRSHMPIAPIWSKSKLNQSKGSTYKNTHRFLELKVDLLSLLTMPLLNTCILSARNLQVLYFFMFSFLIFRESASAMKNSFQILAFSVPRMLLDHS